MCILKKVSMRAVGFLGFDIFWNCAGHMRWDFPNKIKDQFWFKFRIRDTSFVIFPTYCSSNCFWMQWPLIWMKSMKSWLCVILCLLRFVSLFLCVNIVTVITFPWNGIKKKMKVRGRLNRTLSVTEPSRALGRDGTGGRDGTSRHQRDFLFEFDRHADDIPIDRDGPPSEGPQR